MRVFLTAALIGLAQTAAAQGFDEAASKQRCAIEWPNDFNMQAFCLNNQKQGFQDVAALQPTLDNDMLASLEQCRREWGGDHQMEAFCLKNQITARAQLETATNGLPDDVAAVIRSGCKAEWGGDFQMQAFCVGNQVSAWRSLNQ